MSMTEKQKMLAGALYTADDPELVADAARAYGVTYAKSQPPGATEYLMDHSRTAILMDPQGRPVALLPQDEGGPAVAAELKKWVR